MDRIGTKRAQVLAAIEDKQWQGGLLVGNVMTVSPICISPTTSTLELIEMFHAKMFRHLPVTCPKRGLVGIISDGDVARCLGPEKSPCRSRLAGTAASEIMSTDLVTIGPNAPLDRAVQIMVDQGISCLPVLADGTLVGILTNTDLHLVLQSLLEALRRESSAEPVAEPVSNRKN